MPPAVILWWGSELRVLSGGSLAARTLGEKEDPVAVIVAMLSSAVPAPATVRILYHPSTLDVREIACLKIGRTRLRRSLSGEFQVLQLPDTLWSVESIRRGMDSHGTLLYIDGHSRLPRLVDALARLEIRAEGAWPLQTLIEATPPCDRRGEIFLAAIAVGGRALISCVNANGDRFVRFQEGADFAGAALAEIGTALALLEGGAPISGIRVIEDGPKTSALLDRLDPEQLAEMTVADFLDRARVLVPGDLSDFLPRRSGFAQTITPSKFAAILGIVLMVGSAVWTGATLKDQERLRQAGAALGEHRRHMQTAVASRLALRDEMDRMEHALGQMRCPPQRHYELLMALAKSTPDRILLREVTTQGGDFAIRGQCLEGVGGAGDPSSIFRRDLAAAEAPWRFIGGPTGPAPTLADPDFTWRGAFR